MTTTDSVSGPEPPKDHGAATSERRSSSKYSDTKRCAPRNIEKRDRLRKLPEHTVRPFDNILLKVHPLTSHSANEAAIRASKKTIQPKDVLQALEELEFGTFIERCEGELAKFQAVQCDKRNNYRRKVREEAKAKQAADLANGVIEQIPGPPVATIPTFSVRNRDLPPAAKKLRAMGIGVGMGAVAGAADVEGAGPVDVDEDDDVDMNDEAVQEDDVPDDVPDDEEDMHYEDEGAEGEEEIEEDPNVQLVEDPLEEREGEEDEDEVLDREESD